MDGLPVLHPDLQQIIDAQQATSTSVPQPAVQSTLLFPPAPPFSSSKGGAAPCGIEPRPVQPPAALMGAADTYQPEPRPAPPPVSLTTGAVPSCGPDHPPMLPLSASTGVATAYGTAPRSVAPPAAPTTTTTAAIHGPELPPVQPSSALMAAAATYGPPPRPAPLPAPPTAGTTTFDGIENLPSTSCAPKAAILCTVSIPASSPTLGFVAATSSYKPALFAWDPGVEGRTPTVP
jgi:hypothetical protein